MLSPGERVHNTLSFKIAFRQCKSHKIISNSFKLIVILCGAMNDSVDLMKSK